MLFDECEQRPRRALRLVTALPSESYVQSSFTGGVPWTWETEALVAGIEMAHVTNRILLRANGAKKSQVPKPLHIDRPWEMATVRQMHSRSASAPKRQATMDEVFSQLGGMMAGRRAKTDG